MPKVNTGIIYGLIAFLCWGVFPLLWKALNNLEPEVIFSYRIIFCAVFVFPLNMILIKKNFLAYFWREFRAHWLLLLASSALITVNWYVYVLAVKSNQISQGSLGYYLNPLLNVGIGLLFLKEKISKVQSIALTLAAIAIAQMFWHVGSFPVYALTLATTFSAYSLLRKISTMDIITGLNFETFLALPLAILILLFAKDSPTTQPHGTEWLLLMLGGIATSLPLLFFSIAARTVNLSLLGMLQYLSPTLQLIIGVLVFQEPFPLERKIAFIFIWISLLLISLEQVYYLIKRPLPLTEKS